MIARDGALDFDAMQTRLPSRESRIRRLSGEIPAQFIAFDILLWDGEPVWKLPLESGARSSSGSRKASRSLAGDAGARGRARLARPFESMGLDGVVAKKLGVAYLPGSRDGVVKVKEEKTADAVVVGVRWKKGSRETIATLLLGLYPRRRGVDYVGSCAVAAKIHDEVAARVLPLLDESAEQQHFSEPNRWGTGELEEAAIRKELVVEVRYDKVQGRRFRHGTKFLRWRDDKDPADCTCAS